MPLLHVALTVASLISVLLYEGPFWTEKPVAEWTDIQLAQFFADSPWAHTALVPGKSAMGPPVTVYIASAPLAIVAERERDRRLALRRKQAQDPLAEEYHAWFEEYNKSEIILTARVGNNAAFSENAEVRKMEEGCWMRTPRGRVKMTAYFPPTAHDPYLRMAFPRSYVSPDEKNLSFDLYLPGVSASFREVQYTLKDLMIDGKLEL